MFKDHIYATFWFEKLAVQRMTDVVPVENIMFETDFPHPTCLYPQNREHASAALAGLSEYARQRVAFGAPIGKNQAVAHRLVEMKVRLESARLLLYRAAAVKAAGRSALVEAAIAKLALSEAALSSSLDSLQVHGGYGYMTEAEIERRVRDAVGGRIYSGTSEMQRAIVARSLGL